MKMYLISDIYVKYHVPPLINVYMYIIVDLGK